MQKFSNYFYKKTHNTHTHQIALEFWSFWKTYDNKKILIYNERGNVKSIYTQFLKS